jgi:broad specificity phosphatase PhoE
VKDITTSLKHTTELLLGTWAFPPGAKFQITDMNKCYWSLKDDNGTVSWADARITPNGVAQAVKAHDFWASHITSQKIPVPETYYTSPLTRCLQTANITFSGLDLPSRQPFIPTVKELFREGISGHTCDRRGTKMYIQDAFPAYKIEAGFSEDDLLWKPLQGEVPVDEDIRSKIGLDEVFDSDDSTYISITSHSGEIASLLRGKTSSISYSIFCFCLGGLGEGVENEADKMIQCLVIAALV